MMNHVARLETEVETLRLAERSSREQQRDFVRRGGHDLVAPLRGLRSLTSFLREDVGDDLNDDGLNLLDRIDARALHLEQLVSSLTSYARSSDADEEARSVDLYELIDGAIQAASPPGDFAVVIDAVDGDLHLPVAAVSCCIGHIVENAWHHHVTEAGRMSVSATVIDGFAVLVIADDGPGIDDHTAAHAFDAFRAGPPAPLTGSRRAGMGLAIASATAAAHRASIRFTQHGQTGTIVEVRWPLSFPLPFG